MTPRAPAIEAVRVALSLALGRDVASPALVDWKRAYAVARAERLHAVAWRRGGEQIRRHAPPDVIGRWRAECVAIAESTGRQLIALRDIAHAAREQGEVPLVLKGLPLADRLYGDPCVRVCCDIDLFVPETGRASMHALLTRLGWRLWLGAAPFDASYRLDGSNGALFLEVHSRLTGEALAHASLALAGQREWSHDGLTVRTLDGPVLPVYLAANIAKHATPSFMSLVDFGATWEQLGPADREAALRIATQSRLRRCLHWALARANALPAAVAGDPAAFQVLGFRGEQRASVHALLRLAALADRPMDAVRVVGAWLWPRSLRQSRGAIGPFWGRRMRRSFARRFRYTREYLADARLHR